MFDPFPQLVWRSEETNGLYSTTSGDGSVGFGDRQQATLEARGNVQETVVVVRGNDSWCFRKLAHHLPTCACTSDEFGSIYENTGIVAVTRGFCNGNIQRYTAGNHS